MSSINAMSCTTAPSSCPMLLPEATGGGSTDLTQAIADLQVAVDALATAVSRLAAAQQPAQGAVQAMAGAAGGIEPAPAITPASAIATAPASAPVVPAAAPARTPSGYVIHQPLPGARVSSHFGEISEVRNNRPHGGLDLVRPAGTPILAAAPGRVVEIEYQASGGGNLITLDHGDGRYTRYAHMVERSPLKVGDVVSAGDQVGKVGSTGNSTGPHLHFEVLIGGTSADKRVNPEPFVRGERRL